MKNTEIKNQIRKDGTGFDVAGQTLRYMNNYFYDEKVFILKTLESKDKDGRTHWNYILTAIEKGNEYEKEIFNIHDDRVEALLWFLEQGDMHEFFGDFKLPWEDGRRNEPLDFIPDTRTNELYLKMRNFWKEKGVYLHFEITNPDDTTPIYRLYCIKHDELIHHNLINTKDLKEVRSWFVEHNNAHLQFKDYTNN